MGSTKIFLEFKKVTVCSKSSTAKAKWRNPLASGVEGLAGGLGKENNSMQ
jgi:hypothetical protein